MATAADRSACKCDVHTPAVASTSLAVRCAIFFSIAAVGCVLDLATKSWVFNRLGLPGENPPWWLWHGVVGFHTSLNEGALFGFGQGMVGAFTVLSVVALAVIVGLLLLASAAWDRLLTVALAMVTAGILGNLYDRLGLPGLKWNYANELHALGDPVFAVRDWILVMIGNWPWPTFNIADSLLVCGAILLTWHAMRQEVKQRRRRVSQGQTVREAAKPPAEAASRK
ncbi:MAG: signal peptidase II [Planctomycetota bacterium]|jgi:signal peptidase II